MCVCVCVDVFIHCGNSDAEARERILPAIPDARQWRSARVPVLVTKPELTHMSELDHMSEMDRTTFVPRQQHGASGSEGGGSVDRTSRHHNTEVGPLVITVHRGATGLNLQHEVLVEWWWRCV